MSSENGLSDIQYIYRDPTDPSYIWVAVNPHYEYSDVCKLSGDTDIDSAVKTPSKLIPRR